VASFMILLLWLSTPRSREAILSRQSRTPGVRITNILLLSNISINISSPAVSLEMMWRWRNGRPMKSLPSVMAQCLLPLLLRRRWVILHLAVVERRKMMIWLVAILKIRPLITKRRKMRRTKKTRMRTKMIHRLAAVLTVARISIREDY